MRHSLLLLFLTPLLLFAKDKERSLKDDLAPLVVTARGGFPEPVESSSWTIKKVDYDELTKNRSMPEALTGIPSIMVQKTAGRTCYGHL